MSELVPVDGEHSLSTDPKQKFESIFEKMEMMALKQSEGGMNLKSLSEPQKDKLLEVVQKNEDHAFEYHTEKLKSEKEIRLAEIQAGTFQFKTNRISTVCITIAITGITVVIVIFKETFFVPWLTFVTGLVGGLLGGYGLGRSSSDNPASPRKTDGE